ncbi:MAG: sugar phosphate isomerase/epimerase family protein [Acutalibacteraceae bacterium]
MRRGVQLYTVREYLETPKQVEESLRKIKAIGYDSVQGWAAGGLTAKEYVELCGEIGLVNCSSGGEYEEMLHSPAAIDAAIEQAKLFGVKDIAIGTLPKELRESEDGYHTFAAGVNQIAAQLKPEGMRLLYHPHALESYSLGGGRKGLDILIEETDPDGLHFALDTHWLQSAGLNPPDQIRRVKGRMHIVHYKDYKIIGGAVKIEDVIKMFGEVGEGNLDWPAIIQASRDIGVEYAIVEQDICPGDPFASLQISFENLVKFGV